MQGLLRDLFIFSKFLECFIAHARAQSHIHVPKFFSAGASDNRGVAACSKNKGLHYTPKRDQDLDNPMQVGTRTRQGLTYTLSCLE